MKVHKLYCDRCGKEIQDPKLGLLRHKVHYGGVAFDSLRFPKDEWATWHEICMDCEDSFVKWYNHPEKDDDGHG